MKWNYTIYGSPITKKNSQTALYLKKQNRSIIVQSNAYKKFERAAAKYLEDKPEEPIAAKVRVTCKYYMPDARLVDLSNLMAATHDILVHYKILKDDNYKILVSVDGSSVSIDKENPRTEIEIEEI